MFEKPSYDDLKKRVQELEDIEKELILTQKQLQESENRLNSFLSNSPVGIGIWDKEFRYVYINEILQRINGPSLKEHLGKTIEEVLPKAAPIIRPVFEKIQSTGEPALNIELSGEVPAKPGEITHYMLSYFPITDKSESIEYIGGIIVDVTDRKKAEKELNQQQRIFKTIIDNIPALITLYNPKTQVVLVNKAFESTVGWTNHDLKDIDIMEVCYPDQDYRNRAAEYMQKASNEWKEFRIKTKFGHFFDSIWSNVRLEDGTQVGIGIDITEKKQLEMRLLQSEKMESIGNLAGGIAHEFNNILSIIIGNNELIMEDLPEWSISRESCDEIRLAGLRARDIVKHLLTFSRQDDSTKKPINIGAVVTESLKLIRATTPTNIRIRDEISPDCLPIFGDATQINQIIINLCNNAIDAVPISGGRIDISLSNSDIAPDNGAATRTLVPGKHIRLLVKDNGIGIDKKILNKIFEPYFTTKDIGKGSGIGLAVVHGIVDNHGGSIVCESIKDKGTTFSILLPAHEGPVKGESDENSIITGKGEHILYVDDEPSIAKLGKRHLESLGYDAFSVTDPSEALKLIEANPDRFDLVISDMAMPDMPGDQLIREIISICPKMPTIICTGYSSRMSESKASKMGVKQFLMKPLNKSELARKVREVLDSSNQINK